MRIARPPITYYQNAKNATLFRFFTSGGAVLYIVSNLIDWFGP